MHFERTNRKLLFLCKKRFETIKLLAADSKAEETTYLSPIDCDKEIMNVSQKYNF